MAFNIDAPRFTTEQVALAAGVPVQTLAAQLRRGDVVLSPNDPLLNPGQGRTRYFSYRRALHIALTLALAGVGVGVKRASNMALLFTDVGGEDVRASIVDGSPMPTGRQPCELHADSVTVFCVRYPHGVDPVGSVEAFTSETVGTSVPTLTMPLNDLVARVRTSLGVDQ